MRPYVWTVVTALTFTVTFANVIPAQDRGLRQEVARANARWLEALRRAAAAAVPVYGASGASGNTKTSENDQGLSSVRKRSVPRTSLARGRPVAT